MTDYLAVNPGGEVDYNLAHFNILNHKTEVPNYGQIQRFDF